MKMPKVQPNWGGTQYTSLKTPEQSNNVSDIAEVLSGVKLQRQEAVKIKNQLKEVEKQIAATMPEVFQQLKAIQEKLDILNEAKRDLVADVEAATPKHLAEQRDLIADELKDLDAPSPRKTHTLAYMPSDGHWGIRKIAEKVFCWGHQPTVTPTTKYGPLGDYKTIDVVSSVRNDWTAMDCFLMDVLRANKKPELTEAQFDALKAFYSENKDKF
jgi:hypothetical protein